MLFKGAMPDVLPGCQSFCCWYYVAAEHPVLLPRPSVRLAGFVSS